MFTVGELAEKATGGNEPMGDKVQNGDMVKALGLGCALMLAMLCLCCGFMGSQSGTPRPTPRPTARPWPTDTPGPSPIPEPTPWKNGAEVVGAFYDFLPAAETEAFVLRDGVVLFEITSPKVSIHVTLENLVTGSRSVIFSGQGLLEEVFIDATAGTYKLTVTMHGHGVWNVWVWQ